MNSFLLTSVAILSVGAGQVELRDGRTLDGQIVEANQDVVVVDLAILVTGTSEADLALKALPGM